MQFGTRTLAALAQLLSSLRHDAVPVMLAKCGIDSWHLDGQEVLLARLQASSSEALLELMTELCARKRSARADAPTKYVFDDRYAELQRCLNLDGWVMRDDALLRELPSSKDLVELRDELDNYLRDSPLDANGEIRRALESSARAFSDVPPDFNASTTHMRIALETCVRRCALAASERLHIAPPEDRWGAAVAYLGSHGILSKADGVCPTCS